MAGKKLVLIGAGSAMFTQGLVADLVLSNRPWQLSLVDVDPAALKVADGLARKMVASRGVDIQVESSTNRRDLLPGADVVVTTIGVGGRRAWEADFQIPRKYGVFQPVADTAMPGGISRALRMIPAMVDIARDVVDLAPKAHFFNYANPMSVVCWAVRQATGANIIGLCIGVHHVVHQLADYIGKPRNEVTALAAGLNHCTWIYDLRWQGRDAWPTVRAVLAADKAAAGKAVKQVPAPGGDTTMLPESWRGQFAHNRFSWSLFDAYGAYPSANDRHVVEFFPERFPNGNYYGKTLGVDVFSLEETIAHGDKIYGFMGAQGTGDAPLDQGIFERSLGEHSQFLDIMASIDGDARQSFSANLPNGGAIPSLPAEAILEVTAVATGRGLRALHMPDFPKELAIPLVPKIAANALTVEAALRGSRPLFVEALLADRSVAERDVAERLADELLAAHKQYLPQFA